LETVIVFQHLTLDRPLVVLDLETTGINPAADRIIQICVLRAEPDGRSDLQTRLVNPGVPTPTDATAIHGLIDADVAGAPPFDGLAQGLLDFLEGCDLCGFNIRRFDLRMLWAEFRRAGKELCLDGRAIIDAMEIFHAREPRDLAAAVRYYCGKEHGGGHNAANDAAATAEVLDAMLGRYTDLPRSVAGLHGLLPSGRLADVAGFFTSVDGELRFAKGKHRGQPVEAVARREPGYLWWLIRLPDVADDTRVLARQALGQVLAQGAPPT
jgi:DNA polymerase III subunit epsilon